MALPSPFFFAQIQAPTVPHLPHLRPEPASAGHFSPAEPASFNFSGNRDETVALRPQCTNWFHPKPDSGASS